MQNSPSDTKEKILAAAKEVFAEQGFEGTTIRAITERAQANVSAVNYHFGSKEELFRQIIADFTSDIRRCASVLRPAKSFAEFELLLEMFLRQLTDFAMRELSTVELFFNEQGRIVREYFSDVAENFMGFRSSFFAFVSQAQQDDLIAAERNIEVFVKMFLFHVEGELTECKVAKKLNLPSVLNEEFREIWITESVQLFCRALKKTQEITQ